jgi:hypothetical protein
MSVQRNIELIHEILADLGKKHGTSTEQLTYELGYLIGLMAKLANSDSTVYQELKRIRAAQKWQSKP